jgi:outer membrane protein assembly factor BamB
VALDGTVYIACEVGASTAANPSGRLFALTPSGTQKWVYTTTEWIDSSPVVAADGTIYFGCWDGKLYALKPDGTPKWAPRDLGAYISASPALGADGTIYVGTGSGNLYAINPTDGSTKWFYPTLYWIEAAPAVGADGTIYIGSDDNNFYAINPNGTLKWQYTAGNDIASSAAIAADGTLYVGSRDLKLYAFTPSGSVKWTFTNSDMIDASPVLGNDGTVYVATVGGRLFALNPANGTTKWQFPAAGQPALSSLYSTPAVRADGSIILGTSDNAVYALNSDGTQRWKTTVGDWTDSSPVIAPDGTIYIGCTDKNLYALTGTVTQTLTDWPQFLRTPQRNAFQPLGSVAGTTGRLANLSVRTLAGSGDNVLTVGLAITGSNSRNLLVRGIGPSLTQFGVSGVLNDPFMKIIPLNTPSPTATNNNWQDVNGGADISAAGTSVGAFSLPNGSLDSAILASFAPDYQHPPTIQISGNDGGTGIALVELYDTGGNDSARLGNISARSFVNTGDGVLIAGFVVKDNPRSLLIRAVGPRLTDFGLNGVLQKPQLRLYSAYNGISTPWADNVGWSNASNATSIGTVSGNVGAFSLNSGSQDCSMLVTLPPGNYTAQVSGANSTTGIALVEVYEVP